MLKDWSFYCMRSGSLTPGYQKLLSTFNTPEFGSVSSPILQQTKVDFHHFRFESPLKGPYGLPVLIVRTAAACL